MRASLLVAALLILTAGALDAHALPPAKQQTFLSHARELLGVRYEFGGRLKTLLGGIDCQGLLFYAAERIGRCGWKSYSVYPTKTVADGELGRPVTGAAPVATAALDLKRLEPGDILNFVGFAENPAEPKLTQLDGRDVWVWHTAIYSGEGRFIVADHFAGKVVELELLPYLREHANDYAGIFATRMADGPKPARCRRHAPMKRPQ